MAGASLPLPGPPRPATLAKGMLYLVAVNKEVLCAVSRGAIDLPSLGALGVLHLALSDQQESWVENKVV